jgi:hypothetical protein
MRRVNFDAAKGFRVGELVVIACEITRARVARTTPSRILVSWPWRAIDPAGRNSWDGTVGFPRDADDPSWLNLPWRITPDVSQLDADDVCEIWIPPTEVQITLITQFDPPADFGFTPRPEWVLGVCPPDLLDDEEAGYTIYLDVGEPIEISRIT